MKSEDLNKKIADSINNIMNDRLVDIISDGIETSIKLIVHGLLGKYGDITKIMESKIKESMIPYIERIDYGEFITKLDSILTTVVKKSVNDNNIILDNFKDLLTIDVPDRLYASELINKWGEYYQNNTDKDISVEFRIIENERNSICLFYTAVINIICDDDKDSNISIQLRRYSKDTDNGYTIDFSSYIDLSSLRSVDKFQIFLMRLEQNRSRIILDAVSGSKIISHTIKENGNEKL